MDTIQIQRVVQTVGSQTKLARKLGVTPQAVQRWCSGGQIVPVARAIQIEHVLNGKITRVDLRPDIFAGVPVVADQDNSTVSAPA